jgi:hypothetical protein
MKNALVTLFALFPILVFSQKSIDSLATLSSHDFEKTILNRPPNRTASVDSILFIAMTKRLKDEKYIGDEVIMQFVNKNKMGSVKSIGFVDSLLKYSRYRPYLQMRLLSTKSEFINNNQIDSLKLITYQRIEALEPLVSELIRIKYKNYVDLGDLYLTVLNDKNKAEQYYLKGREIPFYLFERGTESDFYRSIYVKSALGQIECLHGNYKRLSDLTFVMSTLPDICPTLHAYMHAAGGDCELCDSYIELLKRNYRGKIKFDDSDIEIIRSVKE